MSVKILLRAEGLPVKMFACCLKQSCLRYCDALWGPAFAMRITRQTDWISPWMCRPTFLGNTMTQHSPDGSIMFLHTNLSPKWNLEIPGEFTQYRRRWKVRLCFHKSEQAFHWHQIARASQWQKHMLDHSFNAGHSPWQWQFHRCLWGP